MAGTNLFEDIQDCLDAMASAADRCANEECSVGEMWNEIDAGCQRLASLSAGDIDDEEDEDLGVDDELNFDGDEDQESNAETDEDLN